MSESCKSEEKLTIPVEIEEEMEEIINVLPEKSRKQYQIAFQRFNDWCTTQKGTHTQYTEKVFFDYFSERSNKVKPSSLWSEFSMIRAELSAKENIDLKNFKKLMSFLKQNSVGFRCNKSKVFNRKQFFKFLNEAPDEIYLLKKVNILNYKI